MIDLRSDLMGPRSSLVAKAMADAVLRTPTMSYEENPDERGLNEALAAELGLEAVLLVPTCTMANQIALRLHLPKGGELAGSALGHIVTVEARATALTGVVARPLEDKTGTLDGVTNDVGVITMPDGHRVALAIFARGGRDRQLGIAQLARAIYDRFADTTRTALDIFMRLR